jgi:putative hydrolase of the HAD superfamily
MTRITTVVSDLGGVLTTPLYDAFKGYETHSSLTLEQLGNALVAVSIRTGKNPMVELETGRLSLKEFLDSQSAELTEQLGRPVSIADFPEVWFSHLLNNTPMLELMAELKASGYRMGLLTNNVKEWEPFWRPRLPIDEIFEQVVDSGFVGMRKPEPEIYALTEQRMGVLPHEILFIDDVDVNIAAAREAGWNAVQFHSNEQAIPEIRARLTDDPSVV